MSDITPTRLLAVDDDAPSAELVARLAAKCGYDARALSEPRLLGKIVTAWKPDLVTLDLCMPEEDGIELFSTLEATGFEGRIVIVSGQDQWLRRSATVLAAARGLKIVNDFRKPIDSKGFRNYLRDLQPRT